MPFCILVLIGAFSAATLRAGGQQESAKSGQTAQSDNANRSAPDAAQNPPPPANQKETPESTKSPPAAAPSNSEQPAEKAPDAVARTPQEQLEEDCANLLKMTRDLKAEMDRTPPDTLSLSVVHKAMAIEQLSHKIQQEMKAEAGKPSAGETDKSGNDTQDKEKSH